MNRVTPNEQRAKNTSTERLKSSPALYDTNPETMSNILTEMTENKMINMKISWDVWLFFLLTILVFMITPLSSVY
jgi:hypothetical protein